MHRRVYTFANTDSNSSALNRPFSFPRPVGTRKKTLQSVIFSLSINVTMSSISATFLRLNVVLIWTGRPISFAQRTASEVRSNDPLIPGKASWVAALSPHCAVRRIRNVGPWTDALLPARTQARSQMEAGTAEDRILVSQYGLDFHGHSQHVARRIAASLGIHRTGHMVCAIFGVHAVRHNANAPLDARSGRYCLCHRRSVFCLVCTGIIDWTFLRRSTASRYGGCVARHSRRWGGRIGGSLSL